MRNQQGRNRRSRGQKDADEDQYSAAIRDDPLHAPKSYSRYPQSSRYGEPHRETSSASSRMTYDIQRDRTPETSRSIRDDGWGAGALGHDRYDYGPYHHAEHDAYDPSSRRDMEDWRGNGESQYSSSRADWSGSYHQSESSTSYPEPSNWNAVTTPNQYSTVTPPVHVARSTGSPYRTTNAYYDGGRSPNAYDSTRAYYHDNDPWAQRDMREPLPDDRLDFNPPEHRRHGWKKENKRDKGAAQQKFQSDSGWSTRKKGKDWASTSENRWDESSTAKNDPAPEEDRSWEPAESWKSGHRSQDYERTQDHATSNKQPQQQEREGGRSSQKSKHSKSNRRKDQSNKQQKRDWRTDDGNLNK